jgi:hypothetical protein
VNIPLRYFPLRITCNLSEVTMMNKMLSVLFKKYYIRTIEGNIIKKVIQRKYYVRENMLCITIVFLHIIRYREVCNSQGLHLFQAYSCVLNRIYHYKVEKKYSQNIVWNIKSFRSCLFSRFIYIYIYIMC